MEHLVHFGSKAIRFQLHYNGRKTLGITVTPDLQVIVKAPTGAALARIKERVLRRAPWILRQQDYFLAFHPKTPARRFVAGETHSYLGKQYTLRIKRGNKNEVHRRRNTIEVTLKLRASAKRVMEIWYREQARQKLGEIAVPLIERFARYKVNPKGLYLRHMPTRWGSCTPKGKIILNPELIKAPKTCIEYVIVHELCHLVHHGHTILFFDLQRRMLPDWEKRKQKLESMMA